jgi:hypothetical protein
MLMCDSISSSTRKTHSESEMATTLQWHALNSIRTLAAQSQNSARKTENKKQNKTRRKWTHE